MNGRRTDREKKLYEDKIISIGKVTKVTQGGRNFRFSATVAENLKLRPPCVTFVTFPIDIILSS